ncbi:MAG: Gfo/Idh/MocA family oxidoreductase [Vicinamibacterales bacterium]
MMTVLIVGLGAIGQRHARNLRRLLGDEIRLLACRAHGRSPLLTDQLEVEPNGDVEGRYGVRVYEDLGQALGERPTAVFVCNPTSLHVPVALAAARAGCHLFVEKPLSNNLEHVADLIEEIDRRALVGMVGYQMRFHPCLLRLCALLETGAVGSLLAVRIVSAEHLPHWHRYEDYRQSYAARRELGGGVVLSQIHDLDYAQWLFGVPRRLFSVGGHFSSLEVDVEDTASILMDCVVDGRPLPVHVHQDFVQKTPTRTCQVVGEQGEILVDLLASNVRVSDAVGQLVEHFSAEGFDRNQMFLDELKHFLSCVRGDAAPVVTVREGAESLRIALAAKESMATGQLVELS